MKGKMNHNSRLYFEIELCVKYKEEEYKKFGNEICLNILLRCNAMQVQKTNLHLSNWHIDKKSYGEGDQINARNTFVKFFVLFDYLCCLTVHNLEC